VVVRANKHLPQKNGMFSAQILSQRSDLAPVGVLRYKSNSGAYSITTARISENNLIDAFSQRAGMVIFQIDIHC
jgi:hypothetical protein